MFVDDCFPWLTNTHHHYYLNMMIMWWWWWWSNKSIFDQSTQQRFVNWFFFFFVYTIFAPCFTNIRIFTWFNDDFDCHYHRRLVNEKKFPFIFCCVKRKISRTRNFSKDLIRFCLLFCFFFDLGPIEKK